MFSLKKNWKNWRKSLSYTYFLVTLHFLDILIIASILINFFKKDLSIFIDGVCLVVFSLSFVLIHDNFGYAVRSHFKKIKTLMSRSSYLLIFYYTILLAFFIERLTSEPFKLFTRRDLIFLIAPLIFLFSLKILRSKQSKKHL